MANDNLHQKTARVKSRESTYFRVLNNGQLDSDDREEIIRVYDDTCALVDKIEKLESELNAIHIKLWTREGFDGRILPV
jgi:hypothetical protein